MFNLITLSKLESLSASTTTWTAIPPKYLDRGAVAFAKSLEDPKIVEAIRKEIYERELTGEITVEEREELLDYLDSQLIED